MRTVEGKVVVLGSQGVGKTSLVVRYIGKMFSHHISPTIGASFFTCNINIDDTRVKLQVWDTAGQERFRSMVPMYYRNANAALLVFDITQYFTFNSIKKWVSELERNVDEPMVYCIVGNKTDLGTHRKVSREEAQQYANDIGGKYFESSALHDEGIEDVFVNTAMELISLSKDPLTRSLRIYDSVESTLRSPSLTHYDPNDSSSSEIDPAQNSKQCC
ncbi:hypothetical protein LSTR_LSTR012020 [Laodelphax striatellus]|uniref:Uncharacterized protein n=1 Tax=Laodelphax striatellus TaxID=195883 RepID=A0A482XM61_LAOST|nr:hypothetical protein LSTR_LSTR012020 [Laodelphax striatellus]